MLLQLKLTDCFVHKNLTVDFQKGLTAISGPNGTGKTLIMEMAEFCLHGSKALRGVSDDYKGVKAELLFSVRGRTFLVKRTISTAALFENGVLIATGTKPVNAKIQELFGYSYEVYKVANVARQGEIERMTNLLPTARKALIDETIGLAKIESLATWVKAQIAEKNAQIRGAEDVLVAPTPVPEAPPKPDPAAVSVLQEQVALVKLHTPNLVEPVKVEIHPRSGELEALEKQQQDRAITLIQVSDLKVTLQTFPPLGATPSLHEWDAKRDQLVADSEAFWKAKGQQKQLQEALKSVPHDPTIHPEEIVIQYQLLEAQVRWKRKQELLASFPAHTCPKCSHHWTEADSRLQDFADLTEEPKPRHTAKFLKEQEVIWGYNALRQTILAGLKAAEKEIEAHGDYTQSIALIDKARKDVADHAAKLEREAQRLTIAARLAAIVVPDDVSSVIAEIKKNHGEVFNYQTKMDSHLASKKALELIPENVSELLSLALLAASAWQRHEWAVASFETQTLAYTAALEKVEAMKLEVAAWKGSQEAVVMLRAKIKGYLLPSLNTVASKLIKMMSNNWLQEVTITEDFEILVDGKRVEVLSGAGKALANLALRIGLGQVLTNGVFSSLTLDESDAGVDKEKAPLVAAALKALTGTIQQVIVISHKSGIESDHKLELS